jgi:hypothetical protein
MDSLSRGNRPRLVSGVEIARPEGGIYESIVQILWLRVEIRINTNQH